LSSEQQQLSLQHLQDFSSQQALVTQSHVHSLVVMASSLTVAIFNYIGQLPKLSGDLFAV
jgi:hypothetical protein